MPGVSLEWEWAPAGEVGLDSRGLPKFPDLASHPGVYRFDFYEGTESCLAIGTYIGESVNLRQRMRGYRSPSGNRQVTNIAINGWIKRILSEGRGKVSMSTVELTQVKISESGTYSALFNDPILRKLLEQAATLHAAMVEQVALINHYHHGKQIGFTAEQINLMSK